MWSETVLSSIRALPYSSWIILCTHSLSLCCIDPPLNHPPILFLSLSDLAPQSKPVLGPCITYIPPPSHSDLVLPCERENIPNLSEHYFLDSPISPSDLWVFAHSIPCPYSNNYFFPYFLFYQLFQWKPTHLSNCFTNTISHMQLFLSHSPKTGFAFFPLTSHSSFAFVINYCNSGSPRSRVWK